MKKRPLLRPTSLFNPYAKHEYWFRKMRRGKRNRKNLGKKEKIKGEYNMVDRINALPDELVFSIVSLLPLKEAAATSILSRRWKHAWKSSMSLNFDVQFGVGRSLHQFRRLEYEEMDRESCGYVNWVDSVMKQHRAPILERFRVCFDIDCRFTTSVDRWIEIAMNKRVQILELEFCKVYGMVHGDTYPFPHKLLGLEKESSLKLKHSDTSDTPNLHSCGDIIGFNFLKVLHFRYVDVTQQVLEYFLSNCPVLERLTVDCPKNLVHLRVAGPSIALKYLVLINCSSLKTVQICDTNLISFYFSGTFEINMLLSNVPLLVEVSYDVYEKIPIARPITLLSCCISQLQILMLNIYRVDYDRNHVFPKFANLKCLELIAEADCDRAFCILTSFLKASPYLQRLVLKLELCVSFLYCRIVGRRGDFAHCPHYNLKVVEVEGYRGIRCAPQVMYLIKNAVALEKIIIEPVRRWRWGDMDRKIEEVEDEVKGRDHAMKHLKRRVPSTIEFVCM